MYLMAHFHHHFLDQTLPHQQILYTRYNRSIYKFIRFIRTLAFPLKQKFMLRVTDISKLQHLERFSIFQTVMDHTTCLGPASHHVVRVLALHAKNPACWWHGPLWKLRRAIYKERRPNRASKYSVKSLTSPTHTTSQHIVQPDIAMYGQTNAHSQFTKTSPAQGKVNWTRSCGLSTGVGGL